MSKANKKSPSRQHAQRKMESARKEEEAIARMIKDFRRQQQKKKK